jgi:hypothetical protein
MYCRICGKDGARADWDELCRKCKKEYKTCEVCKELFLKKEIVDGLCFLCREDREHIYGKE